MKKPLKRYEKTYKCPPCDLTEFADTPIFDPRLFVKIRKRISIEGINEMTNALLKKKRTNDCT